ncbi:MULTISPECIES: phosphopantetheine-binding protein [Streptomyces]|uniref:Phosphopantetheine-binding protein n=1 Tax=Streptomyces edwardsiae TaxID=3075527 RepID=A0ABU2Q226_9ACTN|nr:phosphopantetheine-binding protein [Streptomyces sp. DSM 41636]MDT0397304.1 phosphopantetheine-binding protein [Streptomyces sp. DSM 41636]
MDTSTPTGDQELRTQVRDAVAKLLGTAPGEIPDDANLILLGLGSLEVMRLSSRWRRGGFPVDFDSLLADPTVAGFSRSLAEARARSETTGGAA